MQTRFIWNNKSNSPSRIEGLLLSQKTPRRVRFFAKIPLFVAYGINFLKKSSKIKPKNQKCC